MKFNHISAVINPMAEPTALEVGEDLLEEIDTLISDHVIDSKGQVETGWEMRGLIDCLVGNIQKDMEEDENYGVDYRRGVTSGFAIKHKRRS